MKQQPLNRETRNLMKPVTHPTLQDLPELLFYLDAVELVRKLQGRTHEGER